MKKLCFYTILYSLLLAACAKTDAPSLVNDPVFMITYDIDPPTTITAGKDGIYLFTRYELKGEAFHSFNTFSEVKCPAGDCPGSLTFEFQASAFQDSTFITGTYPYAVSDSLPPTDFYKTNFFWGGNALYDTLIFTILGTNPTSYSSSVSNIQVISPDQEQVITLDAFANSGLRSRIQHTFLPSAPDTFPRVNIQATPEGSFYNLCAETSGPSISQYWWNTGETNPCITVDSTLSLSEYSVTVTSANGDTAYARIANLPFPSQEDLNTANIGIDAILVTDPLQFGIVAIQWVDPTGLIWRSDEGKQGPSSYFEVLKNEPYIPNEKGDTTRKLKVRFECSLFLDGLERKFFGEGVVAMARP